MKAVKNIIAATSGFIAIIALSVLVLALAGFRPFILSSPSMEPLFPKGSFVWVNTRVPLDSIQIGDVLVYRAPSGNLVLHRLVGEGLMQGDANTTAQEVELNTVNYVGREAFHLPWLGDAVSVFLSFHWIVWILCVLLVVFACFPNPSQRKRARLISE